MQQRHSKWSRDEEFRSRFKQGSQTSRLQSRALWHVLSHHATGSPIMPCSPIMPRALPSCHSTVTQARETHSVFCYITLFFIPSTHVLCSRDSISLWVSGLEPLNNFRLTDLSETLLKDKQIVSFALRGITI